MTDIEPWEQPETPAAFTPGVDLQAWVQDFRDVYAVAEALSKTPFVPKEMMGHRDTVAACIMKGKELGLNPFEALGSIYIVHGRPGFYADFMRRRILQAGHIFKIIETTDTRCIVEGVRKDSGQTHRASFTAEQARKAGIDLGRYPSDKLVARATSRLCKQAFPDVLAGSLIAEDLLDGLIPSDDTPEPAPLEPGPPVQRRRKTPAAKAVKTQPRPPDQPTSADTDDDVAELLGDQTATDNARTNDYNPWEHGDPQNVEGDENLPVRDPLHPQPSPVDDNGGEAAAKPPAGEPQPQTLADLTTPQPDEPPTPAMNRKMHALFRQLDITDRNDRLTITSHILGRQITSSTGETGLWKSEGLQLIDTLENWATDTDYPPDDRINDILNTAALVLDQAEQEKLPE